MTYKTAFELNKDSFNGIGQKLAIKNPMQAPKLVKVVVSSGFGSVKDKRKIELIGERLARITGQKPSVRVTKKAIATFKTREGDPVGYQVTLRGKRMTEFLDRLIHVALPRTKDFRGLSRDAVDSMGNFTIGIKEHSIFPETSDEDLKDIFGMAITIVTTSNDRDSTLAFLEHLGMPLKRVDIMKK